MWHWARQPLVRDGRQILRKWHPTSRSYRRKNMGKPATGRKVQMLHDVTEVVGYVALKWAVGDRNGWRYNGKTCSRWIVGIWDFISGMPNGNLSVKLKQMMCWSCLYVSHHHVLKWWSLTASMDGRAATLCHVRTDSMLACQVAGRIYVGT